MRRRSVLFGILAAAPATALAQTVQFEMMSPEEAISLEHSTREQRLRRLVRELRLSPEPEFSQYLISARQLPFHDGINIPVLRVVFPESTFFEVGRAEVLTGTIPIISAMAKMLEGDVPDVAVIISGHTDSTGSEEYNYSLSVLRARSVANKLRLAGADAPDIWDVGFGETLPIYDNSEEIGRSYNRRVEFLFTAKAEAGATWLKDQMDIACTRAGKPEACRAALNPHREFVMQSVARAPRPVVVKPPSRQKVRKLPDHNPPVVVESPKVAVVAPAQKQIVINLAERKILVKRPEL